MHKEPTCGKCAHFVYEDFDADTPPDKIKGLCYAHPPTAQVVGTKPSPVAGGGFAPIVSSVRPSVNSGTQSCGDFRLDPAWEPVRDLEEPSLPEPGIRSNP